MWRGCYNRIGVIKGKIIAGRLRKSAPDSFLLGGVKRVVKICCSKEVVTVTSTGHSFGV